MKRLFFMILFVFAFISCDEFRTWDKHYQYGVIEEVGTAKQPYDGGLFGSSGSYECSVMVRLDDGRLVYGTTYFQPIKNIEVYRMCWKDKRGSWCDVTFERKQ